MNPTLTSTMESTNKRGRKPTGRIRNKLVQIRLSDTEFEKLSAFTEANNTSPSEIFRELFDQLTTTPKADQTVLIKVKGQVIYLTKKEAKQLLISLTEQI